jgi:P2-related tail formation protein
VTGAEQPQATGYLDYLPPVLRSPGLGAFLAAFEKTLTGVGTASPPSPLTGETLAGLGLEQVIEALPRLLDPADTPPDFLPWLAGCVGLALGADLDDTRRRALLARIVPLYRYRGTATGLRTMLDLFLGPGRRTIGIDDGPDQPPHWFEVCFGLPDDVLHGERVRVRRVARTVIEREKPAHTRYRLRLIAPTIRLVTAELAGRDAGARRWQLGIAHTTLGTAGRPRPAPVPEPPRVPVRTVQLVSVGLAERDPTARRWQLGTSATTLGHPGSGGPP